MLSNIEIKNKTKQQVHRWTRVNLFDGGRENIENHKWPSDTLWYARLDNTYENSSFSNSLAIGIIRSIYFEQKRKDLIVNK